MNNALRRFAALFFIMVILVAGLGAGIVLDRQALVAQAAAGSPGSAPNFQLITEAWNVIDREYVDQSAKQPGPLTYGAISGMVNALGDTGHSTFMSAEMRRSQHNYTEGQFEGIGAQVESKDGHVVIVAPFDGSPAQKAGILPGQIILKVDGAETTDLPLEQVVGRIMGPAGTSVTLTILDPKTGSSSDLTLVRARIAMHNVSWQQLPGTSIAHVRVAGFSQGVARELKQDLQDMQKQGITGVVLDLRNNPGGLLFEAIGAASQFLTSGDVLLEKDAQDHVTHLAVRPGGVATSIPMVVLINNGSASASEIVAGALQDAQRAKLVGESTFGTGTVLNEFPLSDGSALMLAVSQWLTPNGRVIWHKGIVPDVAVALPTNGTALMPEGERALSSEQLKSSADAQLLKALDLLAGSASQYRPTDTIVARTGDIQDWQLSPLAINFDFFHIHALV